MDSNKYESSRLGFQSANSRSKNSDNAIIRDISEINAFSTPAQISNFIGSKMKEFIETQLSGNKSSQ